MYKNNPPIITLLILCMFLTSCQTNKRHSNYTYNPDQNKEPIDVIYHFRESDKGLTLNVENMRILPIEFELSMKSNVNEVRRLVVQPESEIILHQFEHLDQNKAVEEFKLIYDYKYTFNDSHAIKPILDYPYRLPFAQDKAYKIVQSFGGQSSHNTKVSYHAIDFDMKKGEPIHAARGGQVVVVIDWFSEGGKRDELLKKANKIIILHDDGTTGSYAHLMYKGSVVKEGDVVTKGQHIGYSGNTGYSGGAHLHFVVRGTNDHSIPIYFQGYSGEILKKWQVYQVVD